MATPQPICNWCGKHLKWEEEAHPLMMKVNPSFKNDVEEHEGSTYSISLPLAGKVIDAIVPTRDSEAKQEDIDLIIVTCGETCALTLRDALRQEKDLMFPPN